MLPETSLHDLQELVLLPAESAWSAGSCDASRHFWWSTGSYAAIKYSCKSKAACAVPRHVCVISMSLCCYQTCLHGQQRCLLLPDKSAWSAGACDATRHVCTIYRNMFCSQTCLHCLHEPVLLSDMSAWSTTVCAAPDMSAGARDATRHVCILQEHVLLPDMPVRFTEAY
jgi:hypothetical protein